MRSAFRRPLTGDLGGGAASRPSHSGITGPEGLPARNHSELCCPGHGCYRGGALPVCSEPRPGRHIVVTAGAPFGKSSVLVT
jgi:hypothetical protein